MWSDGWPVVGMGVVQAGLEIEESSPNVKDLTPKLGKLESPCNHLREVTREFEQAIPHDPFPNSQKQLHNNEEPTGRQSC